MTMTIVKPGCRTSWRRLTQAQHDELRLIRDKVDAEGVAPTYAEMGAALGCNTSTVCCCVHRLCELGYLHRTPMLKRAIRVVRP